MPIPAEINQTMPHLNAAPSLSDRSLSLTRSKRTIRFAFIVILLLLGTNTTQAELYQTISVNVMSPEVFRVARRQYPLSEMTHVVASEIKGTNRVYIKLYIPLGIKKEVLQDIKDRCRKAGATSFFIQYKS
jgi:hypothetical protein